MSVVALPRAPVVDRYLESFARAPHEHLRVLETRGTKICFGPTIPDVLTSDWATTRRNRELTASEKLRVRAEYSEEAETLGIFEPSLDALVLPTAYRARDLDRVVFHELGHAVTMEQVTARRSLLNGLPLEIRRHIARNCYKTLEGEEYLRTQIAEAVAEAYRFVIQGRAQELSPQMLSELTHVFSTVVDGAQVRFNLDPDVEARWITGIT